MTLHFQALASLNKWSLPVDDITNYLKRNNFRLTRDLYNEVIHKYLYKLDGKASLRVAKIAFKLLKLKTKLG